MESSAPVLPVWATVKASYSLTWQNRMAYLKIARWWLILLLPILWFENQVEEPLGSMFGKLCNDATEYGIIQHFEYISSYISSSQLHAIFLALPLELFQLLIIASIGVAWHRLILRNEIITTNRYLRLDHTVLTYFLLAAFLEFFYELPSFFDLLGLNKILTIADPTFIFLRLFAYISVILAIIVTYIIIRIVIILPAKALELKDITLKTVRKKTYGSFWRIFTAGILCYLPCHIIFCTFKTGCQDNVIQKMVVVAVLYLFCVVTLPLYLTYLSLVYRHFFEPEKLS